MEQCKRTVAAVVLALVIALAMVVPVSLPASAAISPDGWGTQTSGTSATIYGVWGDSLSSIFASGEFGTILHYDGNSWTPMSTGLNNVFFGIWGSSSNDVFAVGQNGLIIHYDGNAWTQIYNSPGTHLFGIWGTSSSDVYVVGTNGTILRYNGSNWTTMPNSNNSHLQCVWGTASDDIFAAGNGGTVLHYDGTSWNSMAAGNPPNYSDIWGAAPDDVFVVGNNGAIMHYDGISWTPMTSGVGNDLDAIWGTSGTDVFAAGASGRILHYDGVSWAPMDSGITRNLWGLWGNDPLNVYAVGQSGTILHYKEPAPVVISVNPTYGNQGATMSVTIDGGNFGTATSVDFGADIAVDNFTINNQTRITAVITIDGDAISGPRDVTVTNIYGMGALAGGFTVPNATVTAVSPNSGDQGETIEVTITGTNMGAATGLSFGFGISVDPPTVHTSTQITAQITIDTDAMSGPRSVAVITPGYTAILTDGFTVNGPAVTAVEPSIAEQGETLDVIISGVNLGNATDAGFGDGITVNGIVVNSATQVTANITIDEAAIPGNRDVTVVTADGTAVLTGGFAVAVAQPVTTGLDPAAGVQGQTLDVTISGAHLSDLIAVSFGDGIAINGYSTDNATWIVVNITIDPAAALGARDLAVTTANGIATLDDVFAVLAPEPAISNISPLSGLQGETLDVTIDGTYLNDADAVTFGEGITVNFFSSDNATQIVANITIGETAVPGARDVVVTTVGGTATLADGFSIIGVDPNVSEVSPASGLQGQTLDVTITGAYLTGATVTFGDGITVNYCNTDNATHIVVNISIGETAVPGARDLVITTTGGVNTMTDGFTVVAAEPTVSEVSPASALQGQTLDVTITGAYLTGAIVTFGDGITVNSCDNSNGNQTVVNITISAGAAPGASDVVVTTVGGTATLVDGFSVLVPEPAVSGVSPLSGVQGETLDVTITGSNLSGAMVTFGDGITINSCDDSDANQIVVNITISPAAAPGARTIAVTTDGGTASLVDGFTVVVAEPTLTGVDPANATQGQTLDVVITGTNLNGASAVNFGNGVTVTGYTVDSETQITASLTIEAGALPGARDVSVTTPGGTANLTGAFSVIALPAPPIPVPTLTGTSPASGNQGQTMNVVISGANLTGATAINLGQGITVNSLTVNGGNQVTASITIANSASAGARAISITTPGGNATLNSGFSVTIPAPSLDSIDIPSGLQGETLTVVISGTRLDGTTEVRFGEGITVNSFTVDSSNQITANITIDKDAGNGPRDVTVVTPGGDDSLPAGFDIEEAGNGLSWWLWLLVALAILLIMFLLLALRRKKEAEQE